ncbi:hypothetical protein L210DRAFT_3694803 [Boletus edulis BED1]|uniref:Uncharacterized protein n=1 Tax=Boletus edulis BED1 TaxID=1328754 RepID=A0AAD4BMY6_BOLED|nr:hypothetical protein L210DRAFT_3694803 [Boletus edulis BED1]
MTVSISSEQWQLPCNVMHWSFALRRIVFDPFHSPSQLSDLFQTMSLTDLNCAHQWIQAAEERKHSTTVLLALSLSTIGRGISTLQRSLQHIVTQIRRSHGLSRFLLPPLFADIQIAASCGLVIVVNATQYGSVALIVLPDRDPIHVALPITKSRAFETLSLKLRSLTSRAKFGDVMRDILVLLRELWDVVVFPIAKILQAFCPRGSRIRWSPTAEFSLLPLHTAGSFRKGQPMLSNLYISSYTPTLTAFIRARQKRPLDPSIERHRFFLVGQAQDPSQCKLDLVNTELSALLCTPGVN